MYRDLYSNESHRNNYTIPITVDLYQLGASFDNSQYSYCQLIHLEHAAHNEPCYDIDSMIKHS